jgi:hypothetical protein
MKLWAILLAALIPSYAAAQSTADMTYILQFGDQPVNDDYQNFEMGLSFSNDISNYAGLGYQVDGYYLKYQNYPDDDIYGANFHLTYDLSDTSALGVFWGYESWEGDPYSHAGLEYTAKLQNWQFNINGGLETDLDDGDVVFQASTLLMYNFSNDFSLGGALGYYEGSDITYEAIVEKRIQNGAALRLSALDTRDEGMIYRIAFTKDIGRGAKFRRPDYLAIFSIW